MTVDDSTELVQRVLNEFDLLHPGVELLKSIDHCNAKIVTEHSDFFLKVLVGDHTAANVHARLDFAEFLRDGGSPAPSVIATKSGCRFADVRADGRQRQAIMSRWIDGDTWGQRPGHRNEAVDKSRFPSTFRQSIRALALSRLRD